MKYTGGRLPMYAWASETNQKTYVQAADCLCMHTQKNDDPKHHVQVADCL